MGALTSPDRIAQKNARQRMAVAPLTVDPRQLAAHYSAAFPDRPPMVGTAEWLTGTWAIGACWKNPNPLYGAYPRGYLQRVHAMFPEAQRILHAFSGGLRIEDARAVANRRSDALCDGPGSIELVDLCGPDQGRYPTWQGDVLAMPAEWAGRFDLVLADPPYSPADAAKYGTKMPRRQDVTAALCRVTRVGGVLVWLDVCWPMHRKDQWRTFGHVGVVRSTNHRVRLASMFEAVGGGA
jgi:hypothetical protein